MSRWKQSCHAKVHVAICRVKFVTIPHEPAYSGSHRLPYTYRLLAIVPAPMTGTAVMGVEPGPGLLRPRCDTGLDPLHRADANPERLGHLEHSRTRCQPVPDGLLCLGRHRW